MNSKSVKNRDIEIAAKSILAALGEDINREGLIETPNRYAKFFREFFDTEEFRVTTFKNEGSGMVIQTGIPFYSLCEHHMVPFFGEAAIAYIPDEKIVGLSKLARILEHFSRCLQNQERITKQVVSHQDRGHPGEPSRSGRWPQRFGTARRQHLHGAPLISGFTWIHGCPLHRESCRN